MNLSTMNELNKLAEEISGSYSSSSLNLVGLLPFLYTLYVEHLNINPMDASWPNRDRVIVTNKEKSSTLALIQSIAGYRGKNLFYSLDMPLSLNKNSIETCISTALAQNNLKRLWKNKYDKSFYDFNIYLIIDDFEYLNYKNIELLKLCLREELNQLIIIFYEENSQNNNSEFKNEVLNIFTKLDFFVQKIDNSTNFSEIDNCISNAKKACKPSFIYINDFKQASISNSSTGTSLNYLEIDSKQFKISEEILTSFRNKIKSRFQNSYISWMNEKNNLIGDKFKDLDLSNIKIKDSSMVNVNENILKNMPFENTIVITEEYVKKLNLDNLDSYLLNYLIFGAFLIQNKCIINLKINSSDLLLPALRESNSFLCKNTFVFKYNILDNEHLNFINTINSINSLYVFKPFNTRELVAIWKYIYNLPKVSLILLPEKTFPTEILESPLNINNGAYILSDVPDNDVVLISSGSDLITVLKIVEILKMQNILAKVVSVPSLKLFSESDISFQAMLLPPMSKKIVIESNPCDLWYKYIFHDKNLIDLNKFKNESIKSHNSFDNYDLPKIITLIINSIDKI